MPPCTILSKATAHSFRIDIKILCLIVRSETYMTMVRLIYHYGQAYISLWSGIYINVVRHTYHCGQAHISLWSGIYITVVGHIYHCGQAHITLWSAQSGYEEGVLLQSFLRSKGGPRVNTMLVVRSCILNASVVLMQPRCNKVCVCLCVCVFVFVFVCVCVYVCVCVSMPAVTSEECNSACSNPPSSSTRGSESVGRKALASSCFTHMDCISKLPACP